MRPTALLVDDDPATLLALPDTLHCRLPSLRVETTTDVVDALARLDVRPYSVVLADYRMPRLNGLSFLHEVKRRHAETSVVLMTGTDDRTLEARAFEAGAFDFLPKPLDREDLTRTIQLAVHACRLQRDLKASQERLHRYVERLCGLRIGPGHVATDLQELLSLFASEAGLIRNRVSESVKEFGSLIERNEARLQVIKQSLQSVQQIARQHSQERALRLTGDSSSPD